MIMTMTDNSGFEIGLGDEVTIPEPNNTTDYHKNSFVGIVVGVNENTEALLVKDQDDDCFEIEANRVSVI